MTWRRENTLPPSELSSGRATTSFLDKDTLLRNVWVAFGGPSGTGPNWFAPSFIEQDLYVSGAFGGPTPPEEWRRERDRVRSARERFGEELENLLDAERNIGVGWGDIFLSLQLPISPRLSDATRQARIALRRSQELKVSHGARAGGAPTPFEVAEELLPFLNIMQDEGAILDDTACSDMLLGTASPPPGALGLTYEQIADIAYEVIHSRQWDRAYQQSVCRYLLALDAATTTAQDFVEWVDRYGNDEIRERPDWYKLELIREL